MKKYFPKKWRGVFSDKRVFALAAMLIIASAAFLTPLEVGMAGGVWGIRVKVQTANAASYADCYTPVSGSQTPYYTWQNGSGPCANTGTVYNCTSSTPTGTNVGTDIPSDCTPQNNVDAKGNKIPLKTSTCNSLATCVGDLVYFVTVSPTSEFAYIGSLFLSVGVNLSLQSTAYALTFLQTGWTLARDVANMLFLFAIVYLAITIIVSANSAGTTHTLVLIIVMALLVNFSFFLTRVVIDAGNIAAITVYNEIPAPPVENESGAAGGGNACAGQQASFICNSGTKDLSSSIMGALNIQNLYGTTPFATWAAAKDSLTQIATLVMLYIAVAILFAFVGFIFLAVGAKFLVRIVALWLVIIASPVAFAAYALPQTRHWFNQWIWQLLKNSFYPAIFLFLFLFVILFMSQGAGCTQTTTTAGSVGVCNGLLSDVFNNTGAISNPSQYVLSLGLEVAAIGIVIGLIMLLLYLAMKVSDRAAGAGAHLTTKFPGWAIGRSAGLAGFAGRWSVGLAGAAAAQSETLRNTHPTLWRMGQRAANSSFDARASRLGGAASRLAGAGPAGGKGGVSATLARRSDRLVNRGKALLDTDAMKEKRLQKFIEEFGKDEENMRRYGENATPDKAVAIEQGLAADREKQAREAQAEVQRLKDIQRAQGANFSAADKLLLEQNSAKQRQLFREANEAASRARAIERNQEQYVERPEENRARLEEFIQKGPVLGDNFPGTAEAKSKLRNLLPKMTPIKPSEEEAAVFNGATAAVPTRGLPPTAGGPRPPASVEEITPDEYANERVQQESEESIRLAAHQYQNATPAAVSFGANQAASYRITQAARIDRVGNLTGSTSAGPSPAGSGTAKGQTTPPTAGMDTSGGSGPAGHTRQAESRPNPNISQRIDEALTEGDNVNAQPAASEERRPPQTNHIHGAVFDALTGHKKRLTDHAAGYRIRKVTTTLSGTESDTPGTEGGHTTAETKPKTPQNGTHQTQSPSAPNNELRQDSPASEPSAAATDTAPANNPPLNDPTQRINIDPHMRDKDAAD
ncbi:MAG: type IV secretion system protein [Minisyncoccia bacterium]